MVSFRADPCVGRFSDALGHRKFLARMKETQFARRLDTSGRLVIPIRLREELNLKIGDTYSFFIYEENDEKYLCVKCPKAETELEKAMKIIQQNGMKVVE